MRCASVDAQHTMYFSLHTVPRAKNASSTNNDCHRDVTNSATMFQIGINVYLYQTAHK